MEIEAKNKATDARFS